MRPASECDVLPERADFDDIFRVGPSGKCFDAGRSITIGTQGGIVSAPTDNIATLRAWFQSLADGATSPEHIASLEVPEMPEWAEWKHVFRCESPPVRDIVSWHCHMIAHRLKWILLDVSWASAPADEGAPRKRSPKLLDAYEVQKDLPAHAKALHEHGLSVARIIANRLTRIDEPWGDVLALQVTRAIDVTLDMCENHRKIHSKLNLPLVIKASSAEYEGRKARERATPQLPARDRWICEEMARKRAAGTLSFTKASEAVSRALPRALGSASAKTVRRAANKYGITWKRP